ncbi:hypothetical protein [Nocardia sp. XZ_19_385]|uniref:DUF7691 family protein n=1 Tax=Nocardia sp. XZ_19_385 TaxID=2769488 RepID=UPI00188E95EB|nr:hypothetical protein [Nocardia sp. XZ_19_385]
MSYSLSLYLVDLATVRSAIGSKDDKLRRMMGGRFKTQFAHSDEYWSSEIAEGAPTKYEAVRAVIDGGPFDDSYAYLYGYAYQAICEFHGRFLDNSSFSPFRSGWLELVDEGMVALGLDARISDFWYGSLPAELPRPDFVPCYGEWTADECTKLLEQWAATTPEQYADLDPYVIEAIESCVGWARAARAKPGAGIAGFFF